ncbi:hypothetical protein [Streptomyces sp. NPDC051677]|uniref:DUF6841 family protein n=1 Tax=Streptomyces sp. NPDC051677 TaxID=3365669 RepID=UPI0037D7E6EC
MALPSPELELDATYAEISNWFFEDYLARYITAVGSSNDPSFIAEYWAAPLWVGSDDGPVVLLRTVEEVIGLFKATFDRLQGAGYTHTAVLDHRIVIFNRHSAAVDVIWSRRRVDESEIERLAVHFVIGRREDGLRAVAIEAACTASDSLDANWPVHRGGAQ